MITVKDLKEKLEQLPDDCVLEINEKAVVDIFYMERELENINKKIANIKTFDIGYLIYYLVDTKYSDKNKCTVDKLIDDINKMDSFYDEVLSDELKDYIILKLTENSDKINSKLNNGDDLSLYINHIM